MKLFHTDSPDLKKKEEEEKEKKEKREKKKRKIHDMYTKLRSSGILLMMSY